MAQWESVFSTKPYEMGLILGTNMVEGQSQLLLQVVLFFLLLHCGVHIPPHTNKQTNKKFRKC